MTAASEPGAGWDWRFEELALRLSTAGPGRCAVEVLRSPFGGGVRSEFACSRADLAGLGLSLADSSCTGEQRDGPAGGRDIQAASARRAAVDPSPEVVGGRLFQALFSGDVLGKLQLGLGRVSDQTATGLRIRLEFAPSLTDLAEVSSLPWELLYRADTRDFLARSAHTPLVRFLEVPRLMVAVPLVSALRIMVVCARPGDAAPLALGQEIENLGASWRSPGTVEIEVLDHATIRGLHAKLTRGSFHVLHFMGHGDFAAASGLGRLVFENARGRAELVSGQLLGETIKAGRDLRLVVLNACQSARLPRRPGQDTFMGVASALILAGVPAVVAMQSKIFDGSAIVFSRRFYEALADGLPVDAAAAAGREAVYLDAPESWEWVAPAVFMSMADGRIFRRPPPASVERTAPAPPGRRRWIAATLLALGLAAAILISVAAPLLRPPRRSPGEGPRLEAAAAARHDGEEATVCGFVTGAEYKVDTNGRPTFLDFERPYPDEVFRAVVWDEDRGKFMEPPEAAYLRRNVCVTGRIQSFEGKPEIFVRYPAQLFLNEP